MRKRDPVAAYPPKKQSWRFCLWLLCLPAAGALTLGARRLPGFAEWYARHIYPLPAQPLNRLTSLAPFSVMEAGCALLLAAGLVLAVRLVVVLRRLPDKRARLLRLVRAVLHLCCFGAAGLLAFVLLAGINYHRSTFAQLSGLPLQPSTTQELQQLCGDLVTLANRLAEEVPARDEAGVTLTTDEGYRALADAADAAYAAAAVRYPVLGGSYRRAKPMAASFVMSRMQLTGIFFPFTLESNVNVLAPSFNIPYTIAHELAHLRGFMREDEANYIAWVVCRASDDARLQYSGTLLALIHAGNALARADGAAYAALREHYSPQVLRDLAQNNAYWAQFDDQPLSELSEKTNNAYLKANGQTDGTQSYGRMVDLLLAEWRLAAQQNANGADDSQNGGGGGAAAAAG